MGGMEWVDEEREAATHRVASVQTGDLLRDARFVEVLETWNRHRKLSDGQARVGRALADVEEVARRLPQAAAS